MSSSNSLLFWQIGDGKSQNVLYFTEEPIIYYFVIPGNGSEPYRIEPEEIIGTTEVRLNIEGASSDERDYLAVMLVRASSRYLESSAPRYTIISFTTLRQIPP